MKFEVPNDEYSNEGDYPMKARKFSQVPLLIGLLIGVLALWGGAAPVGATGDLVTGGTSSFTSCLDDCGRPYVCS